MTYPLVRVELEVEGRALTMEAAVLDTLLQLVLLGTNVPDLSEWLKTPIRRSQPWYLALLELLINLPLILPENPRLMMDPFGNPHPLVVQASCS